MDVKVVGEFLTVLIVIFTGMGLWVRKDYPEWLDPYTLIAFVGLVVLYLLKLLGE